MIGGQDSFPDTVLRSRVQGALSEPQTMGAFAVACGSGLWELDVFSTRLSESEGTDRNGTIEYIRDMASRLLPESPAARRIAEGASETEMIFPVVDTAFDSDIHEQLQQRVRSRLDTRIENERHLEWDSQKTHTEPTPYLAVEKLLAWSPYYWRRFVGAAAGEPVELENVAKEMHDCILSVYARKGLIEAVRTLSEELLPDSLGANGDGSWLSSFNRDATDTMGATTPLTRSGGMP